MSEIPQVSDPVKEPNNMRRFTQISSVLLNSLLDSGQIKRTGPDTFTITGAGGLTPGTYTNATVTVDAQGNISAISSGPGGTDPISSVYPIFTVTGQDDEFDSTFTGWTAVNSGSHLPTLTEGNNVLSVNHPGGDAASELHAWMRAPTITTGSFVECAFRSCGIAQNFIQGGVIFADGTTYGSGTQANFFESSSDTTLALGSITGYNNQVSATTVSYQSAASRGDVFLRLVYNGSNSFTGFVSCDGQAWVQAVTKSVTLTPTKAGFFVSTFGGTKPFLWSFRYVKFG